MHPTRDIISAQEHRTGFLLKSTGHKALGFNIQLRGALGGLINGGLITELNMGLLNKPQSSADHITF